MRDLRPEPIHCKNGEWIPILRYNHATLCVVTLACGHERVVHGNALSWSSLANAACFRCRHVRDVRYVTELPLSRENSPRLQ